MSENEPSVEKYLVAYMDILGYRDKIRLHPELVDEFLKTTLATVERIKKIERESKDYDPSMIPRIRTKIFSDNFIICMKWDPEKKIIPHHMFHVSFFREIAELQRVLLWEFNVLTRGSFTIGDLYIDDDCVYGPALIDAYEMENKEAKNPRMIIGDDTFDEILASIDEDHTDHMRVEYFFLKDADGWRYLDYYRPMLWFEPNFQDEPSSEECELMDCLSKIDDSILKVVENANSNTDFIREERNRMKLSWIIDNYNNGCEHMRMKKHLSCTIRTESGLKRLDVRRDDKK
ncbi:MAG: hypothetical protein VB016_04340 [Methanomassiliicoccaceae archaeon]|nr:hypothetical protein [Methanomassiliicoccaceae archaeon]